MYTAPYPHSLPLDIPTWRPACIQRYTHAQLHCTIHTLTHVTLASLCFCICIHIHSYPIGTPHGPCTFATLSISKPHHCSSVQWAELSPHRHPSYPTKPPFLCEVSFPSFLATYSFWSGSQEFAGSISSKSLCIPLKKGTVRFPPSSQGIP